MRENVYQVVEEEPSSDVKRREDVERFESTGSDLEVSLLEDEKFVKLRINDDNDIAGRPGGVVWEGAGWLYCESVVRGQVFSDAVGVYGRGIVLHVTGASSPMKSRVHSLRVCARRRKFQASLL